MQNFDWKILSRYVNALLGVWLMAAPDVLGYTGAAETNDRIIGPLIVAFAIIAIWDVTRPLRRLNTLLGIWLLLAPWIFGYGTTPLINSLVVGLLVIVFSLVKGEIRSRFGGGWSALWRSKG